MSRARLALLLLGLALGCASSNSSGTEGPVESTDEALATQNEPSEAAPTSQPTETGDAAEDPGEGGPAYVYRGPEELEDLESAGVGQPVTDFAWTDVRGREGGTLSDLRQDAEAVVILFTGLRCPVTRLYKPRVLDLVTRYRERGVRFLLVDPNRQDKTDELRAQAERLHWDFAVTRDPYYAICDALGAERTADAFVVDKQGVLAFRGAIDDQFGINYRLPAARNTYLIDALDALLAGEPIAVAATTAPGCVISRVRAQ